MASPGPGPYTGPVRVSARLLALLVAVCASPVAVGCAKTQKLETQAPEVPKSVADLDHFAIGLNQFALLPLEHPRREPFRRVLLDYLVGYIDRTLKDDRPEEAANALQFAATLWRPAELRGERRIEAGLSAAAHRIYAVAARRGNEGPALFAVSVEQQFGDEAARARAVATWTEIEGWLVRNGNFSDEPVLRHEELEGAIEETAANFPSPFVVQRLADLAVRAARHQLGQHVARQAAGARPDPARAALRPLGDRRPDAARRGANLPPRCPRHAGRWRGLAARGFGQLALQHIQVHLRAADQRVLRAMVWWRTGSAWRARKPVMMAAVWRRPRRVIA